MNPADVPSPSDAAEIRDRGYEVPVQANPWKRSKVAHVRVRLTFAIALLGASTGAAAQQIVKIPQSEARVSRPDDLFSLPPGQWHFAKRLWEGPAPCAPTECEGGYTTGELVISVQRSGSYALIIAGFRACEAVGQSELEVGNKVGKSNASRLRKQVERVVKGVAKTCKLAPPTIAALDATQLFPPKPGP
jgi:hypothetical protein